jgi:hypothetical protein
MKSTVYTSACVYVGMYVCKLGGVVVVVVVVISL